MKKRKFYWPWLDFHLVIPFVYISTHVMYQRQDELVTEYIGVMIRIWKWEWRFRLYKPAR